MRIVQVKTNGICNPVGFSLDRIQCSWKVEEIEEGKQQNAVILVSTDEEFQQIVYRKEGAQLKSSGEVLDFSPLPCTRYYGRIEVSADTGESAASDIFWFESGKRKEEWSAEWITQQKQDAFPPEFVKEFKTEKLIQRARLYISGLGLYEAYINGEKAGDELLAPFTSDYDEKIQYQTYDVTGLLGKENTLSVICGNGWYKGRLGYEGHREVYGSRFHVIAELAILYSDGTRETVITDESWKYRESEIVFSDIYDGETVDRILNLKKENPWKQAVSEGNIYTDRLVERDSLPLKVRETLPVQEVIKTPAGETVLDFGQNFAGYVSFSSAGIPRGAHIVLDFGEILQQGNFYNDNYRTAKAQFRYEADGREEIVRPHFTFFGFRYVRVSGWEGEIALSDFTGNVLYSELDATGWIHTGNEKINRLFSNCMWGQKSNFIDLPTDCPQRDERLGWTGDAQVFAPTASFNMDTRAFFRKYLDDLHREQQKWDGAVPNFIPNYPKAPGGAAVWGDSAVFIPMTLYEYYGDREELRRHYPMMRKWVDYLTRECDKHQSGHLFNFGMQFGDWLAMDGITEQSFKGGTDEAFLASVYYYASVKNVAKASEELGESENASAYEELAGQIYEAVLNEYFSNTGRLCIDTQAAYIVCLRFGVYREKARLIDGLKERLRKDCYRIKCGFVGAPVLCQTLAENGMTGLAYRILFFEGFPGWLRCINLGATTIWERWNSVLDDGSISGTNMNSLNHYAYGSVVEFLYRYSMGITPLSPGFSKADICPRPDYRLKKLDGYYDSVSGKYGVHWEILEDGKFRIRTEIPFNCSAVLHLPGSSIVKELEAGVFETEYQPDTDYRMVFSGSSILEELKDSEEAVNILREYAPAAVGMMAGGDKESMSLSLSDMMGMPYMGFEPAKIAEAIEKIREIRIGERRKS